MYISLRTALEHISVETTIDGWVKPHALVVTKLVMWERISQQVRGTKTWIWQRQNRSWKYQKWDEQDMEKEGNKKYIKWRRDHFTQWVKWSHFIKLNKKIDVWDWYLQVISYISSIQIEALKKTNQHKEICKIERKVQGQNHKFL